MDGVFRVGALAIIASVAAGCASTDEDEQLDGATASEESLVSNDEMLSRWVAPPAYSEGKRHSELTDEVLGRLRAIHQEGSGADDAFIKVGDSITYSSNFLDCLADVSVVSSSDALEGTRRFFRAGAWSRRSLASKVGWHTNEPLAGNPPPLDREVTAMSPSFAVVMLGTNDVYEGTQPSYERNLAALVKALANRGIIPILSTIPPMRDANRNVVIAKMNVIVRKVAAEALVPLMDYHLTLKPLPSYGLDGDGVHPRPASTGACDFREAALNAGYNQRNLLALEALDRVRRAVLTP